jgi:hypothetical protein
MRNCLTVLVMPLSFIGLADPAAARTVPAQTRAHAQIHLLRVVARNWSAKRMPGLINPRTHALADNTQAVCRGRGAAVRPAMFTRFTCVVRPLHRVGLEGLYISYRAVAGGGCECHWILNRKR